VAELSPDPDTQAQRLVAAAMAAPTGQTEWIQDWPPGPCADPGTGLRLVARRLVGWALAWSSQHAAAPSALIPVAREASRFDRLMAWDAFAASVAYQSGEPKGVQAVRETSRCSKTRRSHPWTRPGPSTPWPSSSRRTGAA